MTVVEGEVKRVNAKWLSCLVAMSLAGLLVAGCGGGSAESSGATSAAGQASSNTVKQAEPESGVPAEAQAAATGDIPDNQAFLLFDNAKAGYSIRYPEGWARKGSGQGVTFQEKANVIHVVVRKGPAPSETSAGAGVEALRKADPTVQAGEPESLTIKGKPVVKVTYSRMSSADPVTGKRLPLVIDRYEYGNGGKVAVLDMATPEGVDNVDAYRMISESFQWLR